MLRRLASLCLICTASFAVAQKPEAIDVIVYGGTASGVITAYSAAREGLHVRLLEPGSHIGGMVTGGLSATDLGNFHIIGGYARDFYRKAAAHYGVQTLETTAAWYSEPHVDEEIFRQMLAEAGVRVILHQSIREQKGVSIKSHRIQSITTTDGTQWSAKVFIDCSYEGDLLAQSGVPYVVGREAISEYNEDLAGVREQTPAHQFTWPLSAYDQKHMLLPEIDPGPLDTPGSRTKRYRRTTSASSSRTTQRTACPGQSPIASTPPALPCSPATSTNTRSIAAARPACTTSPTPSSSPTTRLTSTTTAPSPPTTSAIAGYTPTPPTRSANRSSTTL